MTKHASARPTSSGFALATQLRLSFVAAVVAAALAGGPGCSHAHGAGDGAKSAHAARATAAAPDQRREHGRADPARPASGTSPPPAGKVDLPDRVRSSAEPGAPMLATSPAGTLRPEALREIQRRLTSRGLLAGEHKAGALDEATRNALRDLQRDSDLPATGVPDDATVRKLGLDPAHVFVAAGHD